MAMNPETNKMEILEALKNLTDTDSLLPSQLVRPNGEPVPEHWSVYVLGEEVILKNYRFKVGHISEGALLLEPLGPVLVGKSNV